MNLENKKEEFAPTSTELPGMDILKLVRSTRKFVAAVVIIVGIAIVGLLAIMRIGIPSQQTFQHAVHFVFPEVEDQKYPNKIPFSLADLSSPAVLQKVYEDNHLEKHDIKLQEFTTAVSVIPYSTTHAETVERFRKQLEVRRLSFSEREQIEEALAAKIKQLSNSNALIRVVFNERIGISPELGQKLVHDIARTWSNYSIEKRGVLKLPGGIMNRKLIDRAFFDSLDYPVAVDLLIKSLTRLKTQIFLLLEQEGSETIVDEETGHTIVSLAQEVDNIENYRLRSLSGMVFGTGLNNQPVLTKLFFERRISMLTLQKEALDLEAAAVLDGLTSYQDKPDTAIATPKSGDPVASNSSGSTSVSQINNDFIERIIELSKSGDNEEYRKELVGKHIKLKNQSIKLGTDLALVKQLLESMEKQTSGPANTNATLLSTKQKDEFVGRLHEVVDQVNISGETVARLYDQLSEKRYSYSSRLYSDLSVERSVINYHPLISGTVIIIALAAMIASAIGAMLLGLVWQVLRRD